MPAHRELETSAQKPEKHLSHRTELDELLEHQSQGFPNPAIRVLHDPPIAGFEISDRHNNNELPASSLLTSRLERPQPQNVELVLVEAALQTEKQSIVPAPRIVDRLVIHEHGIYHAAYLDQLLPVATVPCKPRYFPGSYRPYLTETDFRDHSLESAAIDRAGG